MESQGRWNPLAFPWAPSSLSSVPRSDSEHVDFDTRFARSTGNCLLGGVITGAAVFFACGFNDNEAHVLDLCWPWQFRQELRERDSAYFMMKTLLSWTGERSLPAGRHLGRPAAGSPSQCPRVQVPTASGQEGERGLLDIGVCSSRVENLTSVMNFKDESW